MRDIWEEIGNGNTALASIKNLLNNKYNLSFGDTWSDFIARNLYNGIYNDMDNNIYYYIHYLIHYTFNCKVKWNKQFNYFPSNR